MVENTVKEVLDVLKRNKTMVLTTLGERVWSSRVYFANHGLEIFVILEKSNSFHNLQKNPKVFFVIDRGVPDFFIQGEGKAVLMGSPKEYPFERGILFHKSLELLGFVRMIKDVVLVRIIPEKIYLSDFRLVFKGRKEITVTEELLKKSKTLDKGIPKWLIYYKATRPFAFTVTLMSVFIGTLLSPSLDIFHFFLVLLGVLMAHAGVNALNDLMDYKYGYDDWLVIGSSRTLQDKFLTEKEQMRLIFILLALAFAIGLYLTFRCGPWVMILAILGGFVGIFYQVKPLGFKYRGLGDLSVFLAFGPLLALGSYYVQTGELSWIPVLVSIPVGLLVISILHGNNFRDIVEDVLSGYKTVSSILGVKLSSWYYLFLVIGAYLALVIVVYMELVPKYTLLALLSLPLALKNIKISFNPNYLQFPMLDLFSAKLHFFFGILLTLGLILGRLGL